MIVTITRAVPTSPDIAQSLGLAATQVRIAQGMRALSRAELLAFVRGSDVCVTWVSERVNDEFLDAAGPTLRAICNFAVGVDNIDLDACKRRGIIVTNTPHAVTEGTANMAWALLLAVARRVCEGDRYVRSGRFAAEGPLAPAEFLGLEVTGKTLCIVGAGRIGYATALRGIGFGMRTLYVARSRHLDFEFAPLSAERVTLEQGLARADVVSIHTPLTPETRGLFNAKTIALMKPRAILINTARGPIVDEAALAKALRDGRLYGAGLDVFEDEPRVHPELLALANVVMTPHIGSGEEKYRSLMAETSWLNARAVLERREPPNRVV